MLYNNIFLNIKSSIVTHNNIHRNPHIFRINSYKTYLCAIPNKLYFYIHKITIPLIYTNSVLNYY